jgi:hypothetical protein
MLQLRTLEIVRYKVHGLDAILEWTDLQYDPLTMPNTLWTDMTYYCT